MSDHVAELVAGPGEAAGPLIARIGTVVRTRREQPARLERTYLDTFDWRVHRAGASLSLSGSVLAWQPADGEAVEQRLAASAPPRFVTDLPEGPLRDRLDGVVEMRALLPLATVRSTIHELRVLNRDDKTVARLLVEEPRLVGTGTKGTRHRPLTVRVRVVPVRGYDAAANRTAAALAALELSPTPTPVLVDALAAAGQVAGGYSSKLLVPLDPDQPAGSAVRAVLRALLATMRANEAGVRADTDSEFLHDYRVAVRRTRSALKQLRANLPADDVARFRDGFGWLGDITTPTRDLDVYVLALDDYRAALAGAGADPRALDPLEALLGRRQQEAHAALARAMRTKRYRTLLAEWEAFVEGPPEPSDERIIDVASRRIRKVHKGVIADGRAITPSSPPESLHDLRKRCKELRYLLEFFVTLYPREPMGALIRHLKSLQDNLGEFQDLEVQTTTLTQYGQDLVAEGGVPAETLMTMGLLVEQLNRRQRGARVEFADRFGAFADAKTCKLADDLFGARAVRVLATYNIKGGVGKTSAAVNLAYLAARDGARTLLWDLDPQGAATFLFRVKNRVRGGGKALVRGRTEIDALIRGTDHARLDLLPADFSYRHMDLVLDRSKRPTARLAKVVAPLAKNYDYLFLDCPPSISLVSENVFRAADALLVPLIPTTLSLRTLDQLLRFVRDNDLGRLDVLPFFSMVDRRKALHREILASLPAKRTELLSTIIPSVTDVERMGVHRSVIADFAPKGRAALAYEELWKEIKARHPV